MSQMITINLPDETRNALDDAVNEESPRTLLLRRRFRSLRERLLSRDKDFTDQDVFDFVS